MSERVEDAPQLVAMSPGELQAAYDHEVAYGRWEMLWMVAIGASLSAELRWECADAVEPALRALVALGDERAADLCGAQ